MFIDLNSFILARFWRVYSKSVDPAPTTGPPIVPAATVKLFRERCSLIHTDQVLNLCLKLHVAFHCQICLLTASYSGMRAAAQTLHIHYYALGRLAL